MEARTAHKCGEMVASADTYAGAGFWSFEDAVGSLLGEEEESRVGKVKGF